MDSTTIIISAVLGLAVGFAIAKFLEKGKASKTIINARKDALAIIKNAKNEGENIKKDKIFQILQFFSPLKGSPSHVLLLTPKSALWPEIFCLF